MDRKEATAIIREAYDELRAGFIPERPSWDDLSASHRAELSVFGSHIIAVSKDVDHAIRAKLSLIKDDMKLLELTLARVTGERDANMKAVDEVVDSLRQEQRSHAETIKQHNDTRRELRILADQVLGRRYIDPAKLVERLAALGIATSEELVP